MLRGHLDPLPNVQMMMQCKISRGLFAIWKPQDITSASVVHIIKSTLEGQSTAGGSKKGWLKVGHGGTLDKSAEGVLVIGVGSDCKQLGSYTNNSTKVYEATCELGKTTDTLDASGRVVEEAPWDHIRRKDVERALEAFDGEITQTPPLYSAIKFRGKRFSELARKAQATNTAVPATPEPRTVTIHSLELLRFEPPHFTIAVTCSSGTYVRSLLRDISIKVGSVGYAVSLIRRQQGQFTESMSLRKGDWTLEGISQAVEKANTGILKKP